MENRRVVIFGFVYSSAHRPRDQVIERIRTDQSAWVMGGVEPFVIGTGNEDHGQAVMQRSDNIVGPRRQDRVRADPLLGLRVLPVLPKPRECKGLPVAQGEGVRLLSLPFAI